MIIVGDIGGTKVDLAVCELVDQSLKCVLKQRYQTHKYDGLVSVLKEFLRGNSTKGVNSCFGVAGPIKNNKCHLSNIAWIIDAQEIKQELGFKNSWLINDLEAIAYGVGTLEDSDFIVLNKGLVEQPGNAAVIAAGTGLGEAGLFWDGKTHRPFASEGGHANYAPRTELEIDFLRYLAQRYGDVSFERVVSGMGIYNIYQFLRDTKKAEEPEWLRQEMIDQDPPVIIANHALANTSEICVKTLEVFVTNYGVEAGNLALKYLARSGVYVGGGIAPKILKFMQSGAFMSAFTAKGRFQSLMEAIPVKIINNRDTSLLGAASYTFIQDCI